MSSSETRDLCQRIGCEKPALYCGPEHARDCAAPATPSTEQDPHPYYGPCDGFGPGRACSECAKAHFATEADWTAWLSGATPSTGREREGQFGLNDRSERVEVARNVGGGISLTVYEVRAGGLFDTANRGLTLDEARRLGDYLLSLATPTPSPTPDAGATALREAVIRFLAARDADVDSPANLSAMDNLRLHDAHEAALAELRDVVRTIQETPRNAHH